MLNPGSKRFHAKRPRVVVLHETVYSLDSALNTFLTPHPYDEDQVSYHTLIGLDGSIVDVVDPLKRAYGAGYSAFHGEWAVTNPDFQGSVNNFALHLSLETPWDGQDSADRHSGYTPRQYDALALVLDNWLERFQFPASAITTLAMWISVVNGATHAAFLGMNFRSALLHWEGFVMAKTRSLKGG